MPPMSIHAASQMMSKTLEKSSELKISEYVICFLIDLEALVISLVH